MPVLGGGVQAGSGSPKTLRGPWGRSGERSEAMIAVACCGFVQVWTCVEAPQHSCDVIKHKYLFVTIIFRKKVSKLQEKKVRETFVLSTPESVLDFNAEKKRYFLFLNAQPKNRREIDHRNRRINLRRK